MGRNFARRVRTSRIKRRGFALRGRGGSKDFRGTSLIDAHGVPGAMFENPAPLPAGEGRRWPHVGGIFRLVKADSDVLLMQVHINLVEPVRIEGGGAADDPVNLIIFGEQQLSEKRPVLAGNPGY